MANLNFKIIIISVVNAQKQNFLFYLIWERKKIGAYKRIDGKGFH